jgi:hypothetical protein
MKYQILFDDDNNQLAKRVEAWLDAGWELQGGVSVTLSESDDYRYIMFAQAIVLREVQESNETN